MMNTAGFHLFAVNDGHGLFGHKASADVRIELPERLEEHIRVDKDFTWKPPADKPGNSTSPDQNNALIVQRH
jgi:serine/threonine protein phosphatase PrpC